MRFSLAVFAGLLIALGQAPYDYLFLSIIGIVFLVYFLTEDKQSSKYLFATTWVVYAASVCYWLSYFGFVALLFFVIAQLLFAFAFYFIYIKIRNERYDFLIVPLLWVAFEFVLANIPIFSFSWLSLSTIFIDTDLIFVSRFGGSALVVFYVILSAYLLVSIYVKLANSQRINFFEIKKYLYISVMALGCILITIGFSKATIKTSSETISIASIQGNNLNRELTSQEIQSRYLENSHIALANNLDQKYDLVIFPESAFNRDPNKEAELFEKLSIPAAKANKAVILNTIAKDGDEVYNRNYFYNPSLELMGYYDKKRLVPFGEYVPFGRVIGQWSIFDPIGEGFNHGKTNVVINNIASVICYESTFSSDVRVAIADNAKLLVITTNNRSYRNSGNSQQHLNQSRLRAIEYGISVVHSSISGPSALIENDGNIVSKSSMFERAVIAGELPFGEPNSLFAKIGDWLSLVAIIAVGWLLLTKQRIFNGKIKHR